MGTRVNYGGFVVAGIGFVLTRFTVTLAISEDPVRFYVGGVVPLALGLGLAAFGVALAVADVDASLARTTAVWCVAGLGAMLFLTVLTLVGSTGGVADLETVRSRAYLSNFLIGGSVGGTLTGLYAASNRRQRDELRQQRNRLDVINRMLRHEVLNAVAVIRGYATTSDERLDAGTVIEERSAAIGRTIDEVKHLARRTGRSDVSERPVDLRASLDRSLDEMRDHYPDAAVSVDAFPERLRIRADEHLPQVFSHLLENAVVHAGDDTPRVGVAVADGDVRVSVTDDGPGLPERQRTLLETGDIEEFDDPGTGFGLNIVRLLVEGYGGTVETAVDKRGTTITVVLPRVRGEAGGAWPNGTDLPGVRPSVAHLFVTLVAAVVAGVPYGVVSEVLGGSVAGNGVFYGATNPVVGWLTHEFHSVVFGFVFVSLVSLAPNRRRRALLTHVVIGVGWALVLWAVAASVVAPVWLRLLDIPVPIPNFSPRLLASHLAWGVSLAVLTAWGHEHVTPRLLRVDEWVESRFG